MTHVTTVKSTWLFSHLGPAGHNQQMWNTKSCRSQVQNPRPQQRTPRMPNPARLPLQKRVEMMEMNPWGAELGHHESQKSTNCHQNCWVIVMSYEQKASLERERERERPIWGMSGKCQQASILSQRPNTELSHCGLTWSQFLSILIFQISMVWILDTWSSKFFSSDVRNASWLLTEHIPAFTSVLRCSYQSETMLSASLFVIGSWNSRISTP